MEYSAKIIVSLTTNPATDHIGPFIADFRNTSGGRDRQVTTRIGTAATLAKFISEAYDAMSNAGIELTFHDATWDNMFTARGGLIGTPFSD